MPGDESHKKPRIAIIGGGIIGISTGLAIQEKIPSTEVDIFSEELSPNTTADGAAGIFGLYLLGKTPIDKQVKWAQKTHDWMEKMWKSPLCGKLGLALISCSRMNHQNLPPAWKDVVFGYREMSDQEVETMGRLTGDHKSGTEFLTFTAEPFRFLPYLMEIFQQKGKIIRRKIENISELKNYDVVVNCSGLGANALIGDDTIKPLRGQVMRVSAPWIRKVILDDADDGNYVIANMNSVVLGGTHQHDDWDRTPRDEDCKFIYDGGCALDPSIEHSVKINDWVGLRPGRDSVRLEKENIDGVSVVHNYGHGGSGITVFKGCAEDAANLVQDALIEKKFSVKPSKL